MAEHTPGPWHVGTGNGEGAIFAKEGRMRLEDGRTTLYPIAIMQGYSPAEDEANARLIAASPALLEALKKADSRLVGLERHIATDDLEAYIAEQRKARKAIAQAREVPAHAQ